MADDLLNAGRSPVAGSSPTSASGDRAGARRLNDPTLAPIVAQVENLDENQRWWLAGYLEGRLASAQSGLDSAATVVHSDSGAMAGTSALTVLYGSQTGNAENTARSLSESWRQKNIRAVVHSLGRYKLNRLKKESLVLILVSTHGEGDPPDSALAFVNALMADNAPRLDGLRYAVIGLGDLSYKHFCKPARQIDERLTSLGAVAVCPRLECDLDYEDAISEWENGFLSTIDTGGASKTPAPILSLAVAAQKQPAHEQAEITEKVNLCLDDADKTVWHMELSSDLAYQCGDAVAIVLDNPADLVQSVLACIRADTLAQRHSFARQPSLTLEEILTHHAELYRLNPTQVRRFSELYPGTALDKLIASEKELDEFLARSNIIDLLAFAGEPVDAAAIVALLRPLTDRLYSIASSPSAHPGEIHVTVREQPHGLATPQLARTNVGESLRVYIKPNPSFRLPDNPETNAIFIGAGTGIAPYRSFLSERLEQKQQGIATGSNWLFLGEQSFYSTFLYQLDWQFFIRENALNRIDLAFSRDQSQKIYVHHRLLENAAELYQWMNQGACIYVCGDRGRMALDVHNALEQIYALGAGADREQAQAWLAQMAADGRYQRDIY